MSDWFYLVYFVFVAGIFVVYIWWKQRCRRRMSITDRINLESKRREWLEGNSWSARLYRWWPWILAVLMGINMLMDIKALRANQLPRDDQKQVEVMSEEIHNDLDR